MGKESKAWIFAIALVGALGLGQARATAIINGDFVAGLTGWTASAIGDFGNPLNPNAFISVVPLGSNNVAQFETGAFSDGLFIATLEQTFTVTANKPRLSFDFTLPNAVADPTGTGASPFLDSLFVSLGSGFDFFDLLLMDQFGVLADPFGTAPGVVTLGVPIDPLFDFNFTADLTSLVGESVTLFIDVINEDDGFQFASPKLGNLATVATSLQRPIPEPGSLWLLGLGLLGLLSTTIKKRIKATP